MACLGASHVRAWVWGRVSHVLLCPVKVRAFGRAFGSVAKVQVNVSKIVGTRPCSTSRWLRFCLEAKSLVSGNGGMGQYMRQEAQPRVRPILVESWGLWREDWECPKCHIHA
jgi:hypothetical protein